MWKGIESLDEEFWGWTIKGDLMFPNLMEQPPAPMELLKLVKCICKNDARNFDLHVLRCVALAKGYPASIVKKLILAMMTRTIDIKHFRYIYIYIFSGF